MHCSYVLPHTVKINEIIIFTITRWIWLVRNRHIVLRLSIQFSKWLIVLAFWTFCVYFTKHRLHHLFIHTDFSITNTIIPVWTQTTLRVQTLHNMSLWVTYDWPVYMSQKHPTVLWHMQGVWGVLLGPYSSEEGSVCGIWVCQKKPCFYRSVWDFRFVFIILSHLLFYKYY